MRSLATLIGRQMAKKNGQNADIVKTVPLIYQFPDDVAIERFSDHMVVQRGQHEVHLSFFQVALPIILTGNQEEKQKIGDEIDALPARCVARIVIPVGRLPEFVGALQANLRRSQSSPKGDDTKANGKGGKT